ncbi:MAG: SMODS domain-containing nucleotidyltransferase [Chloroflexota bacterium]
MIVTEAPATQLDDLLARVGAGLELSATQHELAEQHYRAVGSWLDTPGTMLAPYRPVIYPQGSLRIGTTVKPRGREEYDLDLVCEVQAGAADFPTPLTLLDLVEGRLREHKVYAAMIERKNRCVRLNYEHDFHMDILPGCPDLVRGGTALLVPDRAARGWKPSNPKGYALWFEQQARQVPQTFAKAIEALPAYAPARKLPLQRVVQLIKRWRDVYYADDPDNAPISIVLTTLGGHHYAGTESVSQALELILDGIVNSLPTGRRLYVLNPANPAEDLSEKWDVKKGAYEAFVGGISDFAAQWRHVLRQQGLHNVSRALGALFGEERIQKAVAAQANGLQDLRTEQRLGVSRATGAIVSATSFGAVPAPRNTFFGR